MHICPRILCACKSQNESKNRPGGLLRRMYILLNMRILFCVGSLARVSKIKNTYEYR